jgi:HK97 gp10 family phage protein
VSISDTRLKFGLDLPDLADLRREFKQLPNNVAARYLGAALKRAVQPLRTAIRRNTPRGPTGNLQKSVGIKAKTFPKKGTAYVLVGYQNSGGDRGKGYHQGLVEFGTKDRKTKGRIASSWNFPKSGPRSGFTIQTISRGRNRGQVRTSPRPPKAFFKSAKAGQAVDLGQMPKGGRTGQPPIKTAFAQVKSTVQSDLRLQLEAALENAFRELAEKARRGGKFR